MGLFDQVTACVFTVRVRCGGTCCFARPSCYDAVGMLCDVKSCGGSEFRVYVYTIHTCLLACRGDEGERDGDLCCWLMQRRYSVRYVKMANASLCMGIGGGGRGSERITRLRGR